MDIFEKICFTLLNYVWLALLVLACLGAGNLLLMRTSIFREIPRPLSGLIAVIVGLGGLIISLFALGIAGFLNVPAVSVVLAVMVIIPVGAAVRQTGSGIRVHQYQIADVLSVVRRRWFLPTLGFIMAAPLLISPLQPPFQWDELMYHLPQARFWAKQGSLAIDPWLRFPLIPMNFELLYSMALLFENDIWAHLIHALAGWLVAAGIYLGATRFFDRRTGLLAAVIFLISIHQQFRTAYIDLGLTLFVFTSFLCLALWWDTAKDLFLYLSVFFMGLAVGTKYQGLLYLPILVILISIKERRASLLAKLFLVFLFSGGYWYLRSYLVSGDPIHPMGGDFFGYWLWDKGDFKAQLGDVWTRYQMPPWYLMIAAVSVFFLKSSSAIYKGAFFTAVGAVTLWHLTTTVERYLIPAYPFLSFLSAYCLIRMADAAKISSFLANRLGQMTHRRIQLMQISVVMLVLAASLAASAKDWKKIMVSDKARDIYLSKRLGSYAILRSIPNDGTYRIYQFGFENEIYYSPVPVAGDIFGPGRYREVIEISQGKDASKLADHLRSLGLNCLLINKTRAPFKDIQFGPRFKDYFQLIRRDESAELYRLRDDDRLSKADAPQSADSKSP